MNGHAESAERALIQELEAALDLDQSPIDDLLALGQLLIEPGHREAEAIPLFEAILARQPNDHRARYWIAYCLVHYLMDRAARQRAIALLKEITEAGAGERPEPAYAAAAYMLLAEAGAESLPVDERIRLLEASVAHEPGWVYNRQSLAWVYREAQRYEEALRELGRARDNVATVDPGWSAVRRNFEESITGRIGHRAVERINSDIASTSAPA